MTSAPHYDTCARNWSTGLPSCAKDNPATGRLSAQSVQRWKNLGNRELVQRALDALKGKW